MANAWRVLVVDDEEDVHNITRLALKRKTWRGVPVELTHARSGAEARRIFTEAEASFHCALVDVVMESTDDGLKLCDFIRSSVTRSTRIILRTGQPGVAPAEQVLNDYDIDYYLAKTEVTEERLYLTLRACFRSAMDIATLLKVGDQLRAFSRVLQDVAATREGLAAIMTECIRFLEQKYAAKLAFVHDAEAAPAFDDIKAAALGDAVAAAHKKGLEPMHLHAGAVLGLPADTSILLPPRDAAPTGGEQKLGEKMIRWFKSVLKEQENERRVAVLVRFQGPTSERIRRELVQDLELFLANWTSAERAWRLQDRMLRERMDMMARGGAG